MYFPTGRHNPWNTVILKFSCANISWYLGEWGLAKSCWEYIIKNGLQCRNRPWLTLFGNIPSLEGEMEAVCYWQTIKHLAHSLSLHSSHSSLFYSLFCAVTTHRNMYLQGLFGARICKPFMEPRNRFPAWRNPFLGVDSWAHLTFTNKVSGLHCKTGPSWSNTGKHLVFKY
jgi:hypothetical protein